MKLTGLSSAYIVQNKLLTFNLDVVFKKCLLLWVKPETKFWQTVKKNTPLIRWNRIENSINNGIPDLLGSGETSSFFTVELKITYDNKTIKFSPHQIAWHRINTGPKFIMISTRCQSSVKLFQHTIITGQRTRFTDYSPLAVVNDIKDKEQWTTLQNKMLENT